MSKIPDTVHAALQRYDRDAQKRIMREMRPHFKSLLFAWLAWLFLGFHYVYLRRPGTQIFFWITGGGFFLWWLIDFIRIPGLVERHNHETARRIMAEVSQLQIPQVTSATS